MKAEIIGKRIRPNIDKTTGEVKGFFNELHYIEVKEMRPSSKEEECTGRKVGFITTGINIKDVKIGEIYNLDFEVRTFNEKSSVRLVDIELIG